MLLPETLVHLKIWIKLKRWNIYIFICFSPVFINFLKFLPILHVQCQHCFLGIKLLSIELVTKSLSTNLVESNNGLHNSFNWENLGLNCFWPQCVMFQVLLSDIILGLVMILDVEYAFIWSLITHICGISNYCF